MERDTVFGRDPCPFEREAQHAGINCRGRPGKPDQPVLQRIDQCADSEVARSKARTRFVSTLVVPLIDGAGDALRARAPNGIGAAFRYGRGQPGPRRNDRRRRLILPAVLGPDLVLQLLWSQHVSYGEGEAHLSLHAPSRGHAVAQPA